MLTLTVLRCPDAVAPQAREAKGGEIAIGRGADNDWVLPDPERHLSRRHCVVGFRAGGWQVTDTSNNGTFLNRESAPIGPDRSRPLRDGDRLRLGSYEIEVGIAEARAEAAGPGHLGFGADPFAMDPFASDPPAPGSGSLSFADDPLFAPAEPGAARRGAPALGLEAELGPLAPRPAGNPFAEYTQPDHTPAVNDAFRPPRPASILPDDWDLDLGLPGARPAPAAERPAPELPAPRPPEPARPRAPVAPVASPAATPETGSLLAAFLQGVGLPDARPADARATMEALGEAFRALVAGLRQAMIARATIKGEFRIEQTMIRARGNNPLKFSASDDDAVAALIGAGRRVDMKPAEAVAEALGDMRLHELATVIALRTAVRAIIDRFDPAALLAGAEGGALARLSAVHKMRAWDAFEALHAGVVQGLQDDFDGVFGKAFALAYERALQEIAKKDGRR